MSDPQPAPRGSKNRTIPVTCRIHGSKGFCNLRMTKVDGEIVLDPHVANACVLVFDDEAASAVFEFFREALG
jgi:hypothetical protein